VRLSVTNVHLRYEHPDAAPQQQQTPRSLAAGVTLAALRAITVDADGAETFATAGALERVRKARPYLHKAFFYWLLTIITLPLSTVD
jgi:hypothetical protein